jgi:flagellar FliL protein
MKEKEKAKDETKEKVREEKKARGTEPAADKAKEQEQEQELEAKGGMGLLTKILLVAGILALQITAAYFVMHFLFFRGATTEKKPEVAESQIEEMGPMVQLEEIVVNPAGSMGRRFLVVKVALELSKAEIQPEVTRQMPVINDGMIKVLSSKTIEYLSNIADRDSLREELRLVVNDCLRGGTGVNKVFFTGFVLQ